MIPDIVMSDIVNLLLALSCARKLLDSDLDGASLVLLFSRSENFDCTLEADGFALLVRSQVCVR